jgi:hypothetical protein
MYEKMSLWSGPEQLRSWWRAEAAFWKTTAAANQKDHAEYRDDIKDGQDLERGPHGGSQPGMVVGLWAGSLAPGQLYPHSAPPPAGRALAMFGSVVQL